MVVDLAKSPKEQDVVLGRQSMIEGLCKMETKGGLPQGLLFAGKKGVGKSTLVWTWAKHLLCPGGQGGLINTESSSYPLIMAGSHPDLFVMEGESKSEISADAVAMLHGFVAKKPSLAPYKVVIIDALDGLNHVGLNRLLKVLEEPPGPIYYLLVSHGISGVLPTVRSRCQVMVVPPLQDLSDFPGYGALSALEKELADGAPGFLAALAYEEPLGPFIKLVLAFMTELAAHKSPGVESFKTLGEGLKASAWARYVFGRLLQLCIKSFVLKENMSLRRCLPEVLRRAIPNHPLENWLTVWGRWQKLEGEALALNLDWAQVLLAITEDFEKNDKSLLQEGHLNER